MPDVTQVLSHKGTTLFYISNIAGAPKCNCGETAALLIARGSAGSPFSLYVCARGGDDRWQTKCQFRKQAQASAGYKFRQMPTTKSAET